MKITQVRAIAAKAVTVGLLAGAVALTAPAKAQAQRFAVGVQLGYPQYSYPAQGNFSYYAPQPNVYYAPYVDGAARFEPDRRDREWVRAHDFDRDRYDHDRYDRDRDHRDHDDHDDYRGRR